MHGETVFDTSLPSNVGFMVKSSGTMTLLFGGNCASWEELRPGSPGTCCPNTWLTTSVCWGARPGQELVFYAPYQGIIFAARDTQVDVNGIPRSMKKDDFIAVATGTHIVKAESASLIIEVLGEKHVIMSPNRDYMKEASYLSAGLGLRPSAP